MNKKILYVAVFAAIAGILVIFPLEGSADNKKKIKWEKSKDGLGALIDYAKSAGQMAKDSKKEDKSYEKASDAVKDNELKVGMTSSDILNRIGEPVVKVPDPSGDGIRWVYKKGSASYFDGQKVYLYFNNNEILESWEYIPKKDEEIESVQAIEDKASEGNTLDFSSDKKDEKEKKRSIPRKSSLL